MSPTRGQPGLRGVADAVTATTTSCCNRHVPSMKLFPSPALQLKIPVLLVATRSEGRDELYAWYILCV